jgi:hypothetical protein
MDTLMLVDSLPSLRSSLTKKKNDNGNERISPLKLLSLGIQEIKAYISQNVGGGHKLRPYAGVSDNGILRQWGVTNGALNRICVDENTNIPFSNTGLGYAPGG